jgi:hypothetical protein
MQDKRYTRDHREDAPSSEPLRNAKNCPIPFIQLHIASLLLESSKGDTLTSVVVRTIGITPQMQKHPVHLISLRR